MYFIRLRALVFLEYPSTILAEDLGSQYTGNTVVSCYNFNFLAGWEKLTIWNVKIGSNSNIKYRYASIEFCILKKFLVRVRQVP